MTKYEALKLALETLEYAGPSWIDARQPAITAIKEALAQPEQLREENERLHVENRRLIDRIETIGVPVGVGGFATTTTSQPDWIERERAVGYREGHRAALAQRTWVGLTDEEIKALPSWWPSYDQMPALMVLAKDIQNSLKDKNERR